jgi:RNA polymerase sigma factor (sigma-70 family)
MRAKDFIKEAVNPLTAKLKNVATRTQAAKYDPEYQYYGGKRPLQEPIPMQPQRPVAIPDTSSIEQTERNIEMGQLRKILDQYIGTMTPKLQQILKMRYYMGLSLKQVAQRVNLSPERIRQIEAQALRKLRHKVDVGGQLSYYGNLRPENQSIQRSASYQTGYQDGVSGTQYSPSTEYGSQDKEYYRQGYVAGYEQNAGF